MPHHTSALRVSQKDVHVLVLGTDTTLFTPDSLLRKRIGAFADGFGGFHVVGKNPQHGRSQQSEAMGSATVYAARARIGFPFSLNAYRIGAALLRKNPRARWIISAENPFEEGLLALLLARRFGVPFQLQIHTDVLSPWFRGAGWKELLRFALARFVIPRADAIRVVSERIKDSLISQVTFKALRRASNAQPIIEVLPIFTDVREFASAFADTHTEERLGNYDIKMVSVGRFKEQEKNFILLIDMMRALAKEYSGALLVLVGEGPDRKKYEAQIKAYGLEKHIVLEPWRDDLASFYKSFDLFLLSSNYEGWGRAVIEAMAAGLPVVMTDVGVAGEVVRDGENGKVVPVNDGSRFFGAVRDVVRDEARRIELGRAAHDTVLSMAYESPEEYVVEYKNCLVRAAQ